MPRRTSPVWKMDDADFRQLCQSCNSVSAILRYFGMTNHGNSVTVKSRIEEMDIDTSHFTTKRSLGRPARLLEDVLVEGSTYSRYQLKKRLLRDGILVNRCDICGLGDEWNDRPINHRIDHINGVSTDNRLENLRMLCPNCDSQQPTFAGRNKRHALVV